MADANQRAHREVRDAQARFERERAASKKARRETFARAQRAGLSLRDIAEATGLHHSSVAEIIEGK